MKVEDKNKVRVYNEGVLIGIQSDDGVWLERVIGVKERLYPRELFGYKGNLLDRIPIWTDFVPNFLEDRLYPKDRVTINEILESEDVNSRMDLGVKWKFRVWDDDIEVEVPNAAAYQQI